MGRQKFRLLTSWELSKRTKQRLQCQDSRQMFVDFLLGIDYFQLGSEANFLIEGLPGVGGEFTTSLLWFPRQPQTHSSLEMMLELHRKWREVRRKQSTPGKVGTEQQELKGKIRAATGPGSGQPHCASRMPRMPLPESFVTKLSLITFN